MKSGNVVTLKNVLHVSELQKNIFLTLLLTKNEFKYVFVSDKVVIRKGEVYVDNGYFIEAPF